MSQFENFLKLVQSEAIFMCLARPADGIRPSTVMAVALQCPVQVLSHKPDDLRFQAQELTDWFFGGPDPEWLPEHLMFEEVEELVEEYIEIDEDDDGEFEYEIVEEFVEGDY